MNKDDLPAYPRTADEWWAFVAAYKGELRALVGEFHPAYRKGWARPMKITAPAAEAVREVFRNAINNSPAFMEGGLEDPLAAFDQFAAQRSEGLVHLLSETWFGIPESRDAHALPGFGVLCDLCSEAGVLEPEEDPPPRQ